MTSESTNQVSDNQENVLNQHTLEEQQIENMQNASFFSRLGQHFKDLMTVNEDAELAGDVSTLKRFASFAKIKTFLGIILNRTSVEEGTVPVLKAAIHELRAHGEYQETTIGYISEKALVSDEDRVGKELNALLRKKNMPTRSYESEVGIYEWTANTDGERIVYSKSLMDTLVGVVAKYIYRFDDNARVSLRRKASIQETLDNVKRLELENVFSGSLEQDAVIEQTTDYEQGILLDDLLRQRGNAYLEQFDIHESLEVTAQYLREAHTAPGGIGELMTNDILLKVESKGGVPSISGARVTLPDSMYSSKTPHITQKAVDLLEFCFSLSSAALANEVPLGDYVLRVLEHYKISGKQEIVLSEMLNLLDQGFPRSTFHSRMKYGYDRLENKKQHFEEVRVALRSILKTELY